MDCCVYYFLFLLQIPFRYRRYEYTMGTRIITNSGIRNAGRLQPMKLMAMKYSPAITHRNPAIRCVRFQFSSLASVQGSTSYLF